MRSRTPWRPARTCRRWLLYGASDISPSYSGGGSSYRSLAPCPRNTSTGLHLSWIYRPRPQRERMLSAPFCQNVSNRRSPRRFWQLRCFTSLERRSVKQLPYESWRMPLALGYRASVKRLVASERSQRPTRDDYRALRSGANLLRLFSQM